MLEKTIQWMTRDAESLERIGSTRTVKRHIQSLKKGRTSRNANRSILLNYEEGKHGCRFACDYCGWRTHAMGRSLSIPTPGEMTSFLKEFDGYRVTLSGGGDPLYEPNKNGQVFVSILDVLFDLGFLTTVITREYREAVRYPRELVHQWCFSVDSCQTDARTALHDLGYGVQKRVAIVFDPDKDPSWYLSLARFYLEGELPAHTLTIREDMLTNNFRHKPTYIPHLSRMMAGKGLNVNFLVGRACLEGQYWIAGKTLSGTDLFGEKLEKIRVKQEKESG